MTDIADILDKAADLIEPEGAWTQGVLAKTHNGAARNPLANDAACYCLVGGIMRAAGSDWPEPPVVSAVNEVARILKARGFKWGAVVDWNNHQKRTQAEVVAKLREAAAKAREQSA